MLRACRKLLRPGGVTGFFTIVTAPGLSPSDHRTAVRRGPRATATTRPVDVLMRAARFEEVETVDLTAEFLDVARAWLAEYREHETEVRPLLGPEFDVRQAGRRDMVRALEDGLLRRIMVLGRAPPGPG